MPEERDNVLGRRKIKQRRALMFYLITSMPLDTKFEWGNINRIKNDNASINDTSYQEKLTKYSEKKHFAITLKTLQKLRIRLLPDGRVCFAGRMPKGILMPNDPRLQYLILQRMILWYLPCVKDDRNGYILAKTCYIKRENMFLRTLRKALQRNYWKLFKRSYFW